MKISIVFPIHNEFKNLNLLLESWNEQLKFLNDISYEFVLVEDGSTDGTLIQLKKIYFLAERSDIQSLQAINYVYTFHE